MRPTAVVPFVSRVAGSGPIALAFILFAQRAGLDPEQLLIERARIEAAAQLARASRVRRFLAISAGTRHLLDRIIAFPPSAPISMVEVDLAGRAGRTRIHAHDFDVAALGYVTSHEALTATLAEAVVAATPSALLAEQGRACADSDQPLLEIGAEGTIEESAADRLEFGQSALLAEVVATCPPPHPATAFESFDCNGPLALLPIATSDRHFTMVWCDSDHRSRERQQWPRAKLDEAISARFADRLGPLSIEGDLALAPLARVRRRPPSVTAPLTHGVHDPARVWLGNSSQRLHPVAGQGLNLGVRDAFELARQLGECNEAFYDQRRAGVHTTGQRAIALAAMKRTVAAFEHSRRPDRSLLIRLTDTLARGFSDPRWHSVQSSCLTALDLVPALRRPLAATLLFGQRARP